MKSIKVLKVEHPDLLIAIDESMQFMMIERLGDHIVTEEGAEAKTYRETSMICTDKQYDALTRIKDILMSNLPEQEVVRIS